MVKHIMVKKQRLVWLEDSDFRLLIQRALEQGYEGKGRLERLLEKVAREPLIFLPKGFKLKLEVMTE